MATVLNEELLLQNGNTKGFQSVDESQHMEATETIERPTNRELISVEHFPSNGDIDQFINLDNTENSDENKNNYSLYKNREMCNSVNEINNVDINCDVHHESSNSILDDLELPCTNIEVCSLKSVNDNTESENVSQRSISDTSISDMSIAESIARENEQSYGENNCGEASLNDVLQQLMAEKENSQRLHSKVVR